MATPISNPSFISESKIKRDLRGYEGAGEKVKLDFHGLLAQYGTMMMEAGAEDANYKIQEMKKRQAQGREAREAANQIEKLINDVGSDNAKKVKIGAGIRGFFEKYDIEITTSDDGTKKTITKWEGRTEKGTQPSGGHGDYNAAHLRALKAAAEGFGEQASDSRTVDQIEINKTLQQYNGASTLVNTIISSQGSQLNQINGSLRT
ncbi:hypothetical protein [Pandoraea sp. PE-S2T-3]|uniref:hypothetical protein n=1 Tax=Pandoraea sp. PE-S2T-3 TaxID=1986993 RepID=UPI000B402EF6|nr:hypothetical protein [Pandoraea sp. PE-S2T-3]